MVKLTVNKKYQELFDTANGYQLALNNKKEAYLQLARGAKIDSPAQTKAFDAAFTLDFMMASNQQLINYLDFLQKCNNSAMNQTLDKAMDLLNKNEDIHSLLLSINNQISNDNELIHKKRHYYLWRSILSASFALMFAGGGVRLLFILLNPVAMVIYATLVAGLAIALFGGLGMKDAISYERKYHDLIRHTAAWSDRDMGNYYTTLSIDEKTKSTDKNTMNTGLLTRSFTESKTSLRDNFFNKKHSPESLTLGDEVKAEYIALMK